MELNFLKKHSSLLLFLTVILCYAFSERHIENNIYHCNEKVSAGSIQMPDSLVTLSISADVFKQLKKDRYVFSFYLNHNNVFELNGYRAKNYGGHQYDSSANISLTQYPTGQRLKIDNNTYFANIILKRPQIVFIKKAIKKYKAEAVVFKPVRQLVEKGGQYYFTYTISLITDAKTLSVEELDIDFNPSPPKKY